MRGNPQPVERFAVGSVAHATGRNRIARLLVPGVLAVYVAQCVWFIRTQSMTVDESDHIIAGLEAWRFGEFERWHEHPPLARLWFTLPMLGVDLKYENRAPDAGGQQPIHAGSRLDEAFQTDPKLAQGGEGWHLNEEAVPGSPPPGV